MAPTWALPLPCLHPTRRSGVTLPHLAGHRSLCSQWDCYGGWHNGRSPTVRAAMALQVLAHAGGCRIPLASIALLSHGCALRLLPDTWWKGPV